MLLTRFFRDEDGVVSTDYVVLSAAVCGCMILFSETLMNSLGAFSNTAAQEMATDGTYEETFGVDAINGGFEDTYGLVETGDGYAGIEVNGWTASAGGWIDIHAGAQSSVGAASGDHFIDLATDQGDAGVTQHLGNLEPGKEYSVNMSAMDKVGDNAMDVYFGGEKIGTVDAGSDWSDFSFDITTGAGNGSNQLELREVGGNNDSHGTFVDNVTITAN
ncbi:MAG: hypothetical protein AAF919_09250 [Pseudomonadota bacterium]